MTVAEVERLLPAVSRYASAPVDTLRRFVFEDRVAWRLMEHAAEAARARNGARCGYAVRKVAERYWQVYAGPRVTAFIEDLGPLYVPEPAA